MKMDTDTAVSRSEAVEGSAIPGVAGLDGGGGGPSALFILQLPPPRHGASFMGQRVQKSERINRELKCDFVRISTDHETRSALPWKLMRMVGLWIRIFWRLVRNSYDVVYITPAAYGVPFFKDFGVAMLAKWLNGNVVYQFRNKGVSVDTVVPKFMRRLFFTDTTVILLSPLLYFDVADYVPRERVRYLPNGMDPVEGSAQERDTDGKVRILFLSNMIRTKGVFVLLDACRILKQRGASFVCQFAGPWYEVEEEEFAEYVKDAGIADVVDYVGPKYGTDKGQILLDADVFAFPTFYPDECFPGVLLEAMSAHLPVVSTDEGAVPEIVDDGRTGFVVERENSAALADALHQLVSSSELRTKMGENGFKKFSEEYTRDQFETRLIGIVKEASLAKS